MQITNRIHFRNLRGDIFGGLTAAVIALPMALAFGVASGAGAEHGLYGAILVGFFAALFGGTPTLISEPTGPMTVVMTAVIANLTATAPDKETGLAMAFTVVVMAGIIQIALGALKLGRYVTLMPYTVISGFMSGIGVILVILQTAPFLGQDGPGGGVLGTVQAMPDLIANTQPVELALALLTVGILIFSPKKLNKIVPPQLTALIVGTLLSLAILQFGIVDSEQGLRAIGQIEATIPSFRMPVFSAAQFQTMLIDALVLGMLGCIDALLTSVVADSLTRTEHNSNKELIGQGIGNIVSGLFGGLAGAGATMGTVVNIQAGARTAVSGLTRAIVLMVAVLGASSLIALIPKAVLAGIALKVGIDIIDWSFLKRAHKVSVKAALIMYGVIILTVFVDLIVAVGIGVFVANILTIERLTNLRSEEVKTITDADDAIILNDVERDLLDRANNRVLLFQLEGPMIFGVAKAIAREQTAMKDHDVLILDLSEVPHIGVTSSLAIENAIKEAIDSGRHVFIVGAAPKIKHRLQKLGILSTLPPHHIVDKREEALKQALNLVSYPSSDDVSNYPTTDFNETAFGQ
ncbi:MAG: SulP family inorganic anion transporter [Cyanobacteria bacterium P01_A01_bin.68]